MRGLQIPKGQMRAKPGGSVTPQHDPIMAIEVFLSLPPFGDRTTNHLLGLFLEILPESQTMDAFAFSRARGAVKLRQATRKPERRHLSHTLSHRE